LVFTLEDGGALERELDVPEIWKRRHGMEIFGWFTSGDVQKKWLFF
jgi:hypothetical protein